MYRHACWVAVVSGLVLGSSGRGDDDDVSWVDKFTSRELKGYQVEGDVAWNKRRGGIRLNPKAFVAREATMGFVAEARMDVWLPKGLGPKRGLYLTLRERSGGNYTTAFLGLEKGSPILVSAEYPVVPYPLPKAGPDDTGAGPWVLRLRLHYGVVQVKAWPKDAPEPADWQVVRYTGDCGWEPRIVAVHGGDSAGVLERLQVRGSKPATKLFLKPGLPTEREELLIKRMQRVASLRKQGRFRDALPEAQAALRLASDVYGGEHAVTASCVHNLGAVLHDDGRYEESLGQFEKALGLRHRLLPAGHPHLALSLDGTGAALASLGRLDEALKRQRETLALERKVLGDAHPQTSYGWNNLGRVHSLRAEHEQALTCFQESLKVRKAAFGARHPDTAKGLNNLGYQLFVMGEYLKARPYYDEALRVYRDILGPDHPDTAMAENNLGYLLKAMGRFQEALERFDRALAIFTRAGGLKHPLRATVLNNKALVYAELGELGRARTLLEEVVTHRRQALGAHPDTAAALNNLGLVLWSSGDIPASIRRYREALDMQRKTLPRDHPALAITLGNMAELLRVADEQGEARKLLEEALRIKRKRLGDRHPDTIQTLNNLAHLLAETGQPDRAERLLKDALEACKSKLGATHPLTALVHHNLGGVLRDRGRLPDAAGHLRRSLAAYRKTLGDRHPDTARTLNLLAVVLAAQGKRKEALGAAGEASAVYAGVAGRLLAHTAESQHVILQEQWRPEIQVFLGLAAADPKDLAGHEADLLTAVMDWKATSGRALLDRLEAMSVARTPAAARDYETLLVYRRQLVGEIMGGAGADSVDAYNARLVQFQNRVDDLERDLGRQVKGYVEIAQARRASPARVAELLPAGAVLIEFIRHDRVSLGEKKQPEKTGEQYSALLLYRDKGAKKPVIRLVTLGPAAAIEEAITDWRKLTQRGRRDEEVDGKLREKLWDRLAEALPAGTKRLFLAPDGQLALVPFEAIALSDGKFLIERFEVSYVTTGRDLVPRPKPLEALGPPAVLADPDYDLPGGPGELTGPVKRPTGPQARSLAFPRVRQKDERLEGFAVEGEAVVKSLRAKLPGTAVRYFSREQATEENVQLVPRPRLLYLVTHGHFLGDERPRRATGGANRPTRPEPPPGEGLALFSLGAFGEDPRLRSYLSLAGSNRWQARAARGVSDGLLTALEVQHVDLWGTELVVTAACETGVGTVREGEGVLGLRRAFQQAGARTVVATLWRVPDNQTARLMPRFLDLWLAGTPKARALRQAQLELIRELRQSRQRKHRGAPPLYWAAFICHGLPD